VRCGATLTEGLARADGGLFDEAFLLAVAGGEAAGRLVPALEQKARLDQDALLHRLEVLIQVASVAALVAVYAFVGWRLYVEYRQLFGASQDDLDSLMKQLDQGGLDLGR
jgi:type II secretory pathway component PulF